MTISIMINHKIIYKAIKLLKSNLTNEQLRSLGEQQNIPENLEFLGLFIIVLLFSNISGFLRRCGNPEESFALPNKAAATRGGILGI